MERAVAEVYGRDKRPVRFLGEGPTGGPTLGQDTGRDRGSWEWDLLSSVESHQSRDADFRNCRFWKRHLSHRLEKLSRSASGRQWRSSGRGGGPEFFWAK